MNRNIIITIIALVAIVIIVKSVGPAKNADVVANPAGDTQLARNPGEVQPEDALGTPTKIVSGKILEKDDGCFADGICKINVGGTWVITNQGWYQGPLGMVSGDLAVGMNVEAYGKVTDEGITMLGSNSYYVKVK